MKIAVVGTGYVGVVSGAGLASLGHQVTCVDTDQRIVDLLSTGKAHIKEPGLNELISKGVKDGNLVATTNLSEACRGAELILVCVGTPSNPDGSIDLGQIRSAYAQIGKAIGQSTRFTTVVNRSTVVPGTCRKVILPILEKESGKQSGKGFGFCSNPEFLREGCAVNDFRQCDRIVIGVNDEQGAAALEEAYLKLNAPVLRYPIETAEMIKYASNSFFATLISYSNEISRLSETMGVDANEVLESLSYDRRFSRGGKPSLDWTSYLRGGCGFGGSCFPKDVSALASAYHSLGIPSPILDGVLLENKAAAIAAVNLLEKACGPGGVKGKTIAALGLAFKADTDDVRESPAIRVVELISAKGAHIKAYDPQAIERAKAALASNGTTGVEFCTSSIEAIKGADSVIFLTAWPEFSLPQETFISNMRSPVLVDARRMLKATDYPMVKIHSLGKD